MDAHGHIPHLREILIFLAAAGLAVPLLQRRISPVLGYLLLGALIGPFGLGLFADQLSVLRYVVITEIEGVRALAELGVVFLLFTIGLELSFARLWTMRRLVFGLGTMQVLLTASSIALLAFAWGNPPGAAVVLGSCLALSSTAIVTQLLIEARRLGTPVGRAAFSVLLMQDLAVVPILVLVGVIGTAAAGSLASGLGLAFAEAALAVGLIYAAGRLLLKPLLGVAARTGSREAFIAIILLVAIGTSAITGYAGLSMALGAFLAGLMIAETEFRHQVQVDIEPFKGLMLGLFFMSVGMGIDPRVLADDPFLIVASVAGLLVLKSVINVVLCLAWGLPRHHAIEVGLLLSQAGEFAFIVVGLAMTVGLLLPETGQFMLIVAGLTMLLTPLISQFARRIALKLEHQHAAERFAEEPSPELEGHVVIAGFGRVGQTVAAVLDAEQIPYLAIDLDPAVVASLPTTSMPVRFGDGSRTEVLRSVGLDRAAALVIAIDSDGDAMEHLAECARTAAPHVPIYARARDSAHAERLLRAGATFAIPETVEGSLQLAGRVLGGYGTEEEVVQRRLQLARIGIENPGTSPPAAK
jgi:CPA2 family monovalent cation:H+ antiporter-2